MSRIQRQLVQQSGHLVFSDSPILLGSICQQGFFEQPVEVSKIPPSAASIFVLKVFAFEKV